MSGTRYTGTGRAFQKLDDDPIEALRLRAWIERRVGRFVQLHYPGFNTIYYRVAREGVTPEMLDHDRSNDDPVWSGCINIYRGGNSTVGGDVPNLTRYDVQAYLRARGAVYAEERPIEAGSTAVTMT